MASDLFTLIRVSGNSEEGVMEEGKSKLDELRNSYNELNSINEKPERRVRISRNKGNKLIWWSLIVSSELSFSFPFLTRLTFSPKTVDSIFPFLVDSYRRWPNLHKHVLSLYLYIGFKNLIVHFSSSSFVIICLSRKRKTDK